MGKKIKITEEQLKKIIASKQVNEQSAGEVGIENGMDIASESERMINSFVSQYKDLVAGSEFDSEEALLNACDMLKHKLCGDNEPIDYTMGSDDENMMPNPPSEIEMNESVVKIKSEFNRFL
jgi:hypothetical protein